MSEENTPETTEDNKDVDFVAKTEYNRAIAEREQATGLVHKLTEAQQNLQKQLEAYGGLTPEQVAELKAAVEQKKANDAGLDTEQLDSFRLEIKKELESNYGNKLQSYEQELTQARFQLKQLTTVNHMLKQYGDGVLDKARDIIEADIHRYVSIDANGVETVIDDAGNVRRSPTDPTRPMNGQEFFAELRERRDYAFKPVGINRGAISDGQTFSNQSTNQPSKWDGMTQAQYLEQRHTVTDRAERVKLDKRFKL